MSESLARTGVEVGDTVRYTDYALRRDRDYYLDRPQGIARERAKVEYERKRALRGEVVEVVLREYGCGVVVLWNNLTQSRCLAGMVQRA